MNERLTKSQWQLRGVFIALMLAFAAFGAIVSLQPPAPRPMKGSQSEERHSDDEKKISPLHDSAPQIAPAGDHQIQPFPNTKPDNAQTTQDKSQPPQSRWSDPITIVTIALAVIAIIQVRVYMAQAGYMRVNLDLTKKAADAAEAAVKQAVKQMQLEQRAWLKIMPSVRGLTTDLGTGYTVCISNSGKTPAKITQVTISAPLHLIQGGVEPYHANIDDLIAVHKTATHHEHQETVVPPNSEIEILVDQAAAQIIAPDREDSPKVHNGVMVKFFIADVVYTDAIGHEHRTGCCLFYSPRFETFSTHNRHNYMD